VGQLVKLTSLLLSERIDTRISGTILKTLIPNYGFPSMVIQSRMQGYVVRSTLTSAPFPTHCSPLSTALVSLPTSPSTGTIPEEVYSLVALTALYLESTRTEGFLPDMILKLQKLPLLQALGLGKGTSGKQSARVIIRPLLLWGSHFQLWFFQT
jgi:hypothetical protein